MQDAKDKKVPPQEVECRTVPWVDAVEPSVAYITTDLPKPDLCTADPVLEQVAKERRRYLATKPSRRAPRE